MEVVASSYEGLKPTELNHIQGDKLDSSSARRVGMVEARTYGCRSKEHGLEKEEGDLMRRILTSIYPPELSLVDQGEAWVDMQKVMADESI